MTEIPIVIGVISGFVLELKYLEIRGRAKIIPITTLLRSARLLRSVLELKRLDVAQSPVRNYQLELA